MVAMLRTPSHPSCSQCLARPHAASVSQTTLGALLDIKTNGNTYSKLALTWWGGSVVHKLSFNSEREEKPRTTRVSALSAEPARCFLNMKLCSRPTPEGLEQNQIN